jgi:hypothetical protein
MPSKFQDLIDELGTGQVEKLTKPVVEKKFTKVKHQVGRLERGLNFMSDILHLPTTREGYKYLLVIVDLADNSFDIEPLKEIESDNILKGMRAIFRRPHIEAPTSGSSFQTDGGAEYAGATHKYLYDQNIFHKTTKADRHKQQSNVERLNRTLGHFLNNYMSKRELDEKGRVRDWADIVPLLRERLNEKLRLTNEQMDKIEDKKPPLTLKDKEPKFKVGDVVLYKLDAPHDISGRKERDTRWREGDRRFSVDKKKVVRVIYVEGDPVFRYMLSGIKNASYAENELMKVDDEEETYKVREIIGKRKHKGKTQYQIWWRGYKKREATWEDERQLLKDDLGDWIDEYNAKH